MATYAVHAYQIFSGSRVAVDVPFATFQWATTLNDQPLRDSGKRPEFRGVLEPDDSTSLAALTPGETMLIVEDVAGFQPVYAGIIWGWEFNAAQHGFDVLGESVWSYWRRRLITGTEGMTYATGPPVELPADVVDFDEIEQFDIVADLAAHGAATGEAADLRFADVRYFPGGAPSGVVQSTEWTRMQFRSIAAAVEELARQNTGFDFVFSYAWDGGAPPGLLIYLDLWYPQFGAAYATTLTDGGNVTVTTLDRVAYEIGNPLVVVEVVEGPTAYVATINDPNRGGLGGVFPFLDGVFVTREHGRYPAGLTALGLARMLYTRGPVYNGRIDIGPTVPLTAIEPGDTVDLVSTVGGIAIAETERVHAKRVLLTAGELDTWSLDLIDDNASKGVPRGLGDVDTVGLVLASEVETDVPTGLPAGMWAWWDFSDMGTITYISGGGEARVTTVTDKSGNARTLQQTTDANRPIALSHTINSLHVLDFDGVASPDHEHLFGEPLTQAQPFTVFVIAQTDDPGTHAVLLGLDAGLGGPEFSIYGGEWNTWAGNVVAFGTADTEPHLLSAVFGTADQARLDGVQLATGDPGSTGIANHGVYVGGAIYGDGWNGQIGEIIVYPSELSGAEITAVEAYLLAKWI